MFLFFEICSGGGIGRHVGLKNPFLLEVRVRFSLGAPKSKK